MRRRSPQVRQARLEVSDRRRTRRQVLVAAALVTAALSGDVTRADVLEYFNFFGESNTTNPTTSNPDFAAANLDVASTLSRGAGAPSSAGANSFRTVGFQNNGISTANTDYFQFSLSASSGNTLSVSSLQSLFAGTNTYFTAATQFQYAYSFDNSSYTLIGAAQATGATTPTAQLSTDTSGVAALQGIADTATVYFRLYATGATSTGGFGYFSASNTRAQDGLIVNGTLTATGGPATYQYFDVNTTTAGSGVGNATYSTAGSVFNATADGTGAVGAFSGGVAAVFSAGADAAASTYTVNVNSAFNPSGINFEEGTITLAPGTGTLTLAAPTVDVAGTASASITAAIGGSGGLTKIGSGTLGLSATNTYTGLVTIAAGTLNINNTEATLGDAGNDVTFAGGTLSVGTNLSLNAARDVNGPGTFAVTTLTINGTYGATTPGLLTLTNPGTLVLAGSTNTAVGLSYASSGTINVTGGALTLGGNITTTNAGGTATLAGSVNAGAGATRTVTVGDGTAAVDLLISANLTGSAVLAKLGAGTLSLTGNNTALVGTGGTPASIRQGTASPTAPVTGGVIAFDNANALGTGQLQLNGGTLRSDAAGALTIANAGGLSIGAQDAAATPGGEIFGGADITFSGPLQPFNAAGAGYTQAISVNNTTTFAGGFTAPTASSMGLRLLGSGKAIFSGAADNSAMTKPVFIGAATTGSPVTASSSVTVLANATGTAGSLGTGAVTVGGGGKLAGTGSVGTGTVTVASGGTVSAGSGTTSGDSIGTLASAAQTWNAGGTTVTKLNGAATPGTGYDLQDVSGVLNLAGIGAAGYTLLLRSVAGTLTPSATPYELVDADGGIQLNGTPVANGTDLTNLFVLNTDGLDISGGPGLSYAYSINAVSDGSGQDLLLTFTATPEPSTAALVALGGSTLLGRRRRRRPGASLLGRRAGHAAA